MKETRTLTLSVQGEFITQLAREWFFYEGKEYEKVMELLEGCLCGTDRSKAEIRRFAEDIILGRAELKGNSADGTFHLCVYDATEQIEVQQQFNVWKRFSKMIKKIKEQQEEIEKMATKICCMDEYLSEWERREVAQECGEKIETSYGSALLDGFMERMMDTEEHEWGDYGWLEPDGTFHEVDWGEHQKWASEYLKKENKEKYKIMYGDEGDVLIERGWVLLHNPAQGIARPTKSDTKDFTKKQREFLYDYYMERGQDRLANEIWKED